MTSYQPAEDHPFYPWISFYADEQVANTTMEMRKVLDRLADEASPTEREKMKTAFRKSCQLELSFWEMAFTSEKWPVGDYVKVGE
jgi:thiaminase (transcriptional activator TenA)